MKIIDTHTHFLTEDYLAYLDRNNGLLEDTVRLPKWSAEGLLDYLDSCGIDWTVLSVSSPHPYYIEDAAKGIEACRRLNEASAEAKRSHPDRIKWHAVLPLPDVDTAIEEAIYALDVLGADGIKLASNSRGQYLGDSAMEPLFAELDKRGTIVNIHPHKPEVMAENVFTARAIPLFEFFCDTTRAVFNLVANAVPDRYPNIRFVVPHCGAFLPNIADRADTFLPLMQQMGMMDREIRMKESLRKLYYDTCGNPVPDLLPLLMKIADPSHILFGSDYPFAPKPLCQKSLQRLLDFVDSTPELHPHKEAIFYKNAEALYAR